MDRDGVYQFLFKHGYDTGNRGRSVAHATRAGEPAPGWPIVLDAGSGDIGMAAFLVGTPVVGIDVNPARFRVQNLDFHRGSVLALPYADGSFPIVTCVDVLEHLTLEQRSRAVAELVRVAGRRLIIACPHGPAAEECDARFLTGFAARGLKPPDWVVEHQRQAYPDPELLSGWARSAAAALGRMTSVTISYCEPVRITRLLRAAALRSSRLYMAANLLLGIVRPLLPSPGERDSYRVLLTVEFGPTAVA